MPTPKADPGKPESTRRKPFHETVLDTLAPIFVAMHAANTTNQTGYALALMSQINILLNLLRATAIPCNHVGELVHQLIVLWEQNHEKLPRPADNLAANINLLLTLMVEQMMEHEELVKQWADLQQKHPTYVGL